MVQIAEPPTCLFQNDIDKQVSFRSSIKESEQDSLEKPNIFVELSAITNCTQFIERVQDLLDEFGASDERLEMMALVETRAFCPDNNAALHSSCLHQARVPTDGSTRRLAMQLLYAIVSMCFEEDREDKLTKSAVLLDALCANKESAWQTTPLPILCASLVRLVAKQDINWDKRKHSDFTTKLMHLLCGTSSSKDELITNQGIAAMEVHIMDAFRGRLNLPTIQEWITLVCARLNIFTCSKFEKIIMDIRLSSNIWMPSLIFNHAATTEFASRQLAQGLLVLMCGQSGVLPSHLFNSSEVLGSQPRLTSCQLCSKNQLVFLVALEHASKSSRTALQRDAQVVESLLARLQPASTLIHNTM
jgi:hypothetical protein